MNDSEFKSAHQAYEDRLLNDYLDRNGLHHMPNRFKDAKSEYEFWIEAGDHSRAQELLEEELERFYDFYHYETFGEDVQGTSPLVDKTINYLKENTFRNQEGKNELFQRNMDFVLNEKTMALFENLINNKGYVKGFQIDSVLKPMIAEIFLYDVIKFAQESIKDRDLESIMRSDFPILQNIDDLDLPKKPVLFGYGKTSDPLYDKLFQAFYQNLKNDDMQDVLSLTHDLYDKIKHDLNQVEFYAKVSAKGKEDVYAKLTIQDFERLKRGESLNINGQTIEGPNWSPKDWELNNAEFRILPDTIKNQALKNEKFGDHEFSYPSQEVALQENVSLGNFRKMK